MRLGIGLGLFKAGLISAGVRIFSAFQTRVIGDGGTVEAGTCVVNGINGSALLQKASLLLIPSGYKGGKLYSEIPTNGNGDLTWTRGSDAFRTNASGLIQRVPWNLLQRSEEFDNAVWIKSGATITANATIAPNGTTTADTIVDTAVNDQHAVTQTISTILSNSVATLSVYLKKGTQSFAMLRYYGFAGQQYYCAVVNLDNGTITKTQAGSSTSSTSSSITNVGDGWYRLTVTASFASASPAFIIQFTNSATPTIGAFGEVSYLGNGTNSFSIWGAQLVEGTTAQTYLPTTDRLNFPRLSYMYGSCPAVLLEPQRTNLALRSEEFDNASWSLDGVTISANQIASPSGTITADLMTSNGTGQQRIFQTYTVVSGSQYTISIYVKQGTTSTIQIVMPYVGAGPTFTFSSATFNTVSGWTSSVQTLQNGWYRISATATTTSTNAGFQLVLPSNGSSVYLWGAHFEQGAYPTTYIPTTSATATRVADSFSRNNIYTNGLISASGGTWFVELRGNVAYVRDTAVEGLFLGSDSLGTTNSFLISAVGGGGRLRINKYVSSVFTQLYLTTTDTTKIAIKWNGSTADVFVNGTKQVSATAFTATQLQFLAHSTNGDVPKFIQQMALFPTPLSDTDCTTLTTL